MSWTSRPGGYDGEEAPCTQCTRTIKVHMPKGGDTTARMTAWHKDPKTGEWCRSVVDVADVVTVATGSNPSQVEGGDL